MANFPKYQIKRSTNFQHYWVLCAVNAEVLLTSETYTSKESCKAGIASSKISVQDSNFTKNVASNGQPFFNQRANNYQVLGTSEMYNSVQARDNGIAAVKRDAPKAEIEDLT
jgi:uncharacterized protein YegP (UPF0339 family)